MTDLLWWAAIAVLLMLSVTQWIGFDGSKPIAVLQSLSLHAFTSAVPLGVLAALDGRWVIAALCAVPVVTLAWLIAPIRRVGERDAHVGPTMSLAFGNLLAKNRHPSLAIEAMAASDADLLVMVEFTPDMHAALDALVGAAYPHRVADVRPNPAGIGVWSRVPMTGEVVHLLGRPSVDAIVRVDGHEVRVLAIHTTPPTLSARKWRDEVRAIGDAAEGGRRTVLVGDFNAARWHPSFRALLARGWRSTHEVLGHAWTVSWPMRGYPAPPFVRIDHALVNDGITPTNVRETPLPGSDHRGFVMSFGLSSGRPAAR